ncbi:MAG: ribosome biogenesis GTPase YlqF [Rubrivivax sp.]|nr:ribosome biogenesis GTPase YlqF [Rubrivivax sp.]
MPIQWFPGHMATTRKAITERLPDIDVVIELLDARLPGSSANPLLAQLTAGKPALKILNKADKADPERTALWLAFYNAQPQTRAVALSASESGAARQLIGAARALAPLRGGMVKPLRLLVCGIPNVGKSTLINTLLGQRAALTGDEPGITKLEQRIALASDVVLFDTPGMLWPRITVDESGYNLAASGAIGRNAYDELEVALELLGRVREPYAAGLRARYRLGDIGAVDEIAADGADGASDAGSASGVTGAEALLAEIGKKRGGLMSGGRIDLHKAAEITLNDFRSGAWGAITLETPAEFASWQAAGQVRDAERSARREARLKKPVPQRGAGEAPRG